MNAKELAGLAIPHATKTHSSVNHDTARVILVALAVWIFSLAVSLFVAVLIRP